MTRNTSKTIQERVAATHVQALDVDLDAMAVISNIFRVSVKFRNQAEQRQLSQYNLSFSGFTVLWVLWVWGRKQSYELAAECGIAKGTLTGVVTTLEKYGLAERVPHQSDGRCKYVQLSGKGQALMEWLFLRINALEKAFTAELTQSEQQELSRLLRIILHTETTGAGTSS